MSSRAERRRRQQIVERPAAERSRAGLPRAWITTGICLGLLALVVVLRFVWLQKRITWYLAVDQFGYVTFARDILHGHLFHQWPPADALATALPPRTDVLVQSYIWDGGRIYSRYAPGFPILLAAWIGLLGNDWAHYLNPTLFCVAIVLIALLERRFSHSWWRAVAAAALVPLCPSQIHWWGLTLTRDIATHVVAFTGIYLLLPSGTRRLGDWRTAGATLALGFAASMRPDAVMYLLPASLLVVTRFWRERRDRAAGPRAARILGMSALGYALGVAPVVAYDLLATGSLLPPQSVELNNVLGALSDVILPSAWAVGWHGGTIDPVQGGALQLANLARVLPAQLAAIHAGYGTVLSAAAVWGVVVSAVVARPLFFAAVPYCIVSLLFFSCWVRPDARYLIGFHLWIPLLILAGTAGTLDLARRLARRGRAVIGQVVAATLAIALLAGATLANTGRPPLPLTTWLVGFVTAAGGIGAALWPHRRVTGLVAPALALGLAGLSVWTDASSLGRNASFQRTEMLRARATIERAVEPNGVVITTEDVGRPMENIEHYGGRHALYLTDLHRWKVAEPAAAGWFILNGMRPYLLLPIGTTETGRTINALEAADFRVELLADVPPTQAMDYFVAAPFHRGVRMGLWRVRHEKGEAALAEKRGGVSGDRSP